MVIDITTLLLIVIPSIGWSFYMTRNMILIKSDISSIRLNLNIIDWEKVPKKNLNQILKGDLK